MTSQPKCLTCPHCGEPPLFAWIELTPWFCPNDACEVFSWDPYSTAKENLEDEHEMVWEELPPLP